MHIEEEIDPFARHRLAHNKHLGRGVHSRRCPLAVQIASGGVGAQMAAATAVGVHIRHHKERAALKQCSALCVGWVEQPLQRPLHPPLRHGLAGVLARD